MAQQNNTRIRQQRRQRLIIIITSLILAGAGVYFTFAPKQATLQTEQKRPLGMIALPLANVDIPIGTRIGRNMVKVSYFKPSEVPIDAIISPKEYVGRFARRTILASEYFRESDISEAGAHSGYSGIAKPGMRVVHIDARLFPGSLDIMRIGDKLDILSIESVGTQPNPNNASTAAQRSAVSVQGGGVQPGDPNAAARQVARNPVNQALTSPETPVTATLIAESAEVLYVPKARNNQRSQIADFVVFQMTPEDAHVSILAATIGRPMRVVFRPFSDESRLTPVKEVKVTTRLPKPSKDPENIVVITGLQRNQQKPLSESFREDSENTQRKSIRDENLVLMNEPQQSNAQSQQYFNQFE